LRAAAAPRHADARRTRALARRSRRATPRVENSRGFRARGRTPARDARDEATRFR
jgi:hypothetical protein